MSDPDFYAVGEKEHLTATEIEDAVQEYIDDLYPDEIPESVVVHGYARMLIKHDDACFNAYLDDILERLDDEYGDPDGDYTTATDEMKSAMNKFANVVISEYSVWMAERCGDDIHVSISVDADNVLTSIKVVS